jgi:hypothetical protein
MNKTCSGAPISNLNLCNNTCLECTSSSAYKCSSCNSAFLLATDSCLLDNNIHNYTYNTYLNTLDAENIISDLKKFIYADTGTNIGPNKLLEICKENTYEFFIAGPFKDTNTIGLNYDYTDPIDQIQIKFNFMSLVQDVTLYVEVNDVVAFQKKFTIFSDLIGTYGKNADNSGPNYLILNALTPSNVGSVIAPVDIGIFKVISNSIRIKISIVSKSPGYCWGFNDLVVIQRTCETCPTKAVVDLLNELGNLCYVVAAIVLGLLLVLFLMIKLENLMHKWDMEEKLGSSNSLPIKAINRMVDALQRSTQAMEKEFKIEDKRFEKSLRTIVKRE